MYKNRVKNDRKKFEIPARLSCERGNSERVLNFPTPFSAEFPRSQDKREGISN